MLCETSTFHSQNIGGNPCPRATVTTESTMQHDIVALGQDECVLIAQRIRQAADKVEQAVSPRLYVALCWI